MHDNDSPGDSSYSPTYLSGSSLGEQANAGVTPHDHPFSAAVKVETDRRNNGLDIHTGLPVGKKRHYSNPASSPGSSPQAKPAERIVDAALKGGGMRRSVRIIVAILGGAMALYIAHYLYLSSSYDIRNPPAHIADKIR